MHCVGREVLEGGMQGGNRKIEGGDELEPGEGRRDVVGVTTLWACSGLWNE